MMRGDMGSMMSMMQSGPTERLAPAPQDEARTVTVEGGEFFFSPSEIRLAPGETVNIEFENEGHMFHTLTVAELGLGRLASQRADRCLGLRLVEFYDDFSKTIHALGNASDQPFRHDRARLRGLGEVHHLADVAPAVAARAAHDVDGVLVAARGDEPDPRAFLLDDRVGADRGAVREEGDVAAEMVEADAEMVDGVRVPMWAFKMDESSLVGSVHGARIPGPALFVLEGDMVHLRVRNRTVRVVNAHFEAFDPFEVVRAAQAQELLAGPLDTDLPVVLLGDFNSRAPDGVAYGLLVGAGFTDVWSAVHPTVPGPTCCHAADLRNEEPTLTSRIDLVLISDGVRPRDAHLVGVDPDARTPSGLWPSDHAGVVATVMLLAR